MSTRELSCAEHAKDVSCQVYPIQRRHLLSMLRSTSGGRGAIYRRQRRRQFVFFHRRRGSSLLVNGRVVAGSCFRLSAEGPSRVAVSRRRERRTSASVTEPGTPEADERTVVRPSIPAFRRITSPAAAATEFPSFCILTCRESATSG